MIILYVLLATLALWVFFIITTKVADGAKSRKDLNKFQLVLVYTFVVFDVVYNYSYGALLFWEFADRERKTLTARLRWILLSGNYHEEEKRYRLALFMCKYMVSPWDFNHCGMGFGDEQEY